MAELLVQPQFIAEIQMLLLLKSKRLPCWDLILATLYYTQRRVILHQ